MTSNNRISHDKHTGDVFMVEDDSKAEAGAPHEVVTDKAAANYVDSSVHISPEENKALRRKIHRRVLPFLCLAYICQALDKGTMGSSSIMGWQADVGAVGNDFALTGTILWCGIIAGEPLANQVCRRFPLGKLLAIGILVWSVLLLGLGFSLNIPSVFAVRFLLGFFEALVGPCALSITVQWYLKSEQPFVSAVWQCMLGANNLVSSLLAYGFYHIKSHRTLHGWQWMHIAIAGFSFVSSIVIWFGLPDSPTSARWATEDEKVKFVERVRSNNQGIKQTQFKKEQVYEAFTDPYTYLLFLLAMFQTLVVGGIGTFNSLLINQAFGFSVTDSQLLNIPLGAMLVLMYLLIVWVINKTDQTLYTMIAFTIPNIIGSVVLITVTPGPKTRGGLIVAFYIMQCFQACNPAIFLMLSRNSAGHTKRSITYAVTYIGWAGGNAAAPQLFQAKWKPRYNPSLEIHLGLYVCFIITCLVTRALLVRRNKAKLEGRGGAAPTNTRAYEDLTDLENVDLVYAV